MLKKGQGYTDGGGGSRTAIPRGSSSQLERPWGEETPKGRPMAFARHMGVHVIQTESPTVADPRQELIDQWEDWRSLPANERYRILDMVFEHYITDGGEGFLLYITYSK